VRVDVLNGWQRKEAEQWPPRRCAWEGYKVTPAAWLAGQDYRQTSIAVYNGDLATGQGHRPRPGCAHRPRHAKESTLGDAIDVLVILGADLQSV